MSSKRQDGLAILVLTGMVAFFCLELIWDNRVPFYRDMGVYFYPMRFSLAQSLSRGELPLWDRHVAMGFPLLADFQSGAFYPPHLIFIFLPFFTAVRVVFILHFLIACVGSYALCRHWKYPPYLALVGAVTYGLGGTIVSLTNLLNHFQTAVWLPWVILFWERVLYRQTQKDYWILTSISLVQFLAGSPEIYLMTVGIALLVGLRISLQSSEVRIWRPLILLLGGGALIAGLAMVQLLPTIELFLQSRGEKTVFYPESVQWSLQPWSLLNLFFLDKEADPALHNGLNLFFVRTVPFLISHYLGVISLLGIFFWLCYRPMKEKVIVLGLIALTLILVMGKNTPVYALFYRYVPLMNFFRFPEKIFFLTNALLLFISLSGLRDFLEPEGHPPKASYWGLHAIFGVFAAVYLFCRWDTAALVRFILWVKDGDPFSSRTIGSVSGVLFHLEREIALLAGILLLVYVSKTQKLAGRIFQPLLVGLVFFDLAAAHKPYLFALDPQFVWQPQKVIQSPDAEPRRLFYYPAHSSLHPSFYLIDRSQEPSLAEFNSIVFANVLPNTGVLYGFDYMQEIDALRRWPYLAFLEVANRIPPESLYRLLRALNVSSIMSFQALPEGGISLARSFPEYSSWLYAVKDFVPRAYIVPRASVEQDPIRILGKLASVNFNPRGEVILDKPLAIRATAGFHAEARIVSYTNHQVRLQASLNAPGVLVLTDSFYPGWYASADGQEKEILRANLFFRGIFLEPGEHLIKFNYQPRSFFVGGALSLLTLAGILLGFVVHRLKRRRSVVHSS